MNKFWRLILIGLGRFDFEAEEKAKKELALKTRPLLKLSTPHHHEVYKRLCDEAIEKSSAIIAKCKEEVDVKNSTCPACGGKNVVDKMIHAGHTTLAINRCKTCENEWNKAQPVTSNPGIENLYRKARIVRDAMVLKKADSWTKDDFEKYREIWNGVPLAVFESLLVESRIISSLYFRLYHTNFNASFLKSIGITELEEAGYDVGSDSQL